MKNEITYTQQGDYLLPDLELPKQPKVEIGIWGRRHECYIKRYHKIHYFNLLIKAVEITLDGDFVSAKFEYDSVRIERIRRITGYLVGDLDRFNDAKYAEVMDRVKHSVHN